MSSISEGLNKYGLAIGVVFAALIILHLPIIGLINYAPMFKEVIIGVIVVVGLTNIRDVNEGVKFALVSGMIAAVIFNIFYIPFSILVSAFVSTVSSVGVETSTAPRVFGIAIGILMPFLNLIGVVLFSPVGYAVGGAIGTLVNDESDVNRNER